MTTKTATLVDMTQAMLAAAHRQDWEGVAALELERAVIMQQWDGEFIDDSASIARLRQVAALNDELAAAARRHQSQLAAAMKRQHKAAAGARSYQRVSTDFRA